MFKAFATRCSSTVMQFSSFDWLCNLFARLKTWFSLMCIEHVNWIVCLWISHYYCCIVCCLFAFLEYNHKHSKVTLWRNPDRIDLINLFVNRIDNNADQSNNWPVYTDRAVITHCTIVCHREHHMTILYGKNNNFSNNQAPSLMPVFKHIIALMSRGNRCSTGIEAYRSLQRYVELHRMVMNGNECVNMITFRKIQK